MGDFEDAYASWRGTPFPPGSTRDSLDELHADLALADAWIAEGVVPFVERGLYQPAQVSIIEELRKLRTRAADLARASDGGDKDLAASYRDYAGLLLRIYEVFLAQGGPDQ